MVIMECLRDVTGELVASACSLSFLGVAVKITELIARACLSLLQLGAGEVPARKLVLYLTITTLFHYNPDSTR
jgi:hypothetical protein